MKTKKPKFDVEGYEIKPGPLPDVSKLRTPTQTRIYSSGKLVERRMWGGVRVGAGRKPVGHVRMQIVVTPQTRRRIEALAKREHLTLSGAVERLVAAV